MATEPTNHLSDYRQPDQSAHFHISLVNPVEAEVVARALRAVGLDPLVTPSSHEVDGVFITDRMASFTWDSQTGTDNCEKTCVHYGERPHRNYRDISDVQRQKFLDRVLRFMNRARGEMDMDLSDIGSMEPAVAVQECD